MSRTHLVIPDAHALPGFGNERADWVGQLILDMKPDVVVNIGDQFDMPSLSSYDKGTRSFQGRTYADDIAAGRDFSERLWGPTRRAKKRKPYSVVFEGNHENRIERALDLSPELVGTVSMSDLDFKRDYHDYIRYTGKSTPGVFEIDGVSYAHFLVSGTMGRAVGGEHPAYSLISKQFTSCTMGHSHALDFCQRPDPRGRWVMGLVAGCLVDYPSAWAGEQQKYWWSGVTMCHDVDRGQYDPEFISMSRLREAYAVR